MKIYNLSNSSRFDLLASLTIFIVSFIFYYLGCVELLNNEFYGKINLAFDLDQAHFFHSVGKGITSSSPLLIKHPFIYLYHYIVFILNGIGFSEEISVIIISQLFHSGSLVISFFIFRCMKRTTIESTLLTIGLSGTSTYISSGLVLDVYSLSIFWISLIFLIVCNAVYKNYDSSVWLRAVVAVMAVGTTTYLIILILLMEFSLVKRTGKDFFSSIKNTEFYKQLIRVFSIGILLFIIVYYQMIFDIIQDPVGIIKRVFWTVNRPGDKEGLLQVISVFSIFSIISPIISIIKLPEGILMIDLRIFDFSYIGWVVVVILAVSFIYNCKKNEHRFILLFSLIWLFFNVVFHTIYQYRGSLFLYCGHFVLATWILFVTRIEIHSDNYSWQEMLYKWEDKFIVYVVPFLIWSNNLYLYRSVINLV